MKKEMDQETIDRMNEAIALFMQLTPRLVEYPNKQLNRMEVWRNNHSCPMEYHSSWEWLMPVVEKIESTYEDFHGYFGVHISSNSCCIQGTKLRTEPGREHYAYFNEVTHDTKLSATYNAVYLFIQWQWYRKQNNTTNEGELVITDKERKLLTLFERIVIRTVHANDAYAIKRIASIARLAKQGIELIDPENRLINE